MSTSALAIALFHPSGEAAGFSVGRIVESDALKKNVGIVVRSFRVDRELDVFSSGQALVHTEIFGKHPDRLPHGERFVLDVVTEYCPGSRRRRREPEEHVNSRRLPGTVRPKEAVNFPFVDLQIQGLDRRYAPELSSECFCVDFPHTYRWFSDR